MKTLDRSGNRPSRLLAGWRGFAASLALAGLSCGVFAQPTATPEIAEGSLTEQGRIALRDFDAVWETVRESYYDPEMGGLDWDAVRDELRPRAAAATSASARRSIINQMVGRLGQSHFGLISAEAANPLEKMETDERFASRKDDNSIRDGSDENSGKDDNSGGEHDAPKAAITWAPKDEWERAPGGEDSSGLGDPGIEARLIEGRLLVTRVVEGSAAHKAGVETGWELALVAGVAVDEMAELLLGDLDPHTAGMYAWLTTKSMLEGEPGTKVRVGMLDRNGDPARLVLERGEVRGPIAKFGNLPPMVVEVEHRWLTPDEHGQRDDARVGYVRFSTWMFQARQGLDRAMLEFEDADAIVLDLRGNLGGIAALAPGISGYFLEEKASLGELVMRENTLTFNVRPVRASMTGKPLDPFTGRVAIVQDELSASTSEIFAAGIRAIDRVRIFGSRSAGQALPALPTRLPSGDVLMHVIANYIPPEGGVAPEGGGVVPDVYIPLTPERVANGGDPALSAAAHWAATGLITTETPATP